MSRIRMVFGSSVAALAVLVLSAAILAQDPTGGAGGQGGAGGGGGGRGGRGGGGPGGFGGGPGGFGGGPGGFGGGPGGFFGGPGGPGGGQLQLALNPAVQEDGKYTDKQKEQLKEANDAISKKRQEAFKNMGFQRGNRGATKGANKGANNNANGNGAANAKGAANANANGNAAQDPTGGNPNAGGGGFGGGRGFGGQPPDPEAMQAAMEKMQKAMQSIQKQTDEALKKILKKEQIARLSEIELRRQGPMAVFREDISQKLGISEEQMEMMQQVRNDMRTGQREARKSQGAVQKAIRVQMQAAGIDTNPPPADPNAPAQKGGGGRNRGPNREAEQKFLASNPELKKQMDDAQKATDQVQDQAIAAIGEVLTKSQKNKFNKMLGKPFDVEKLRNFGPGGPGGPPPATDDTAKTEEASKKDDAAKSSSTKKSTTKKTTTKPTTKKKSSA